MNPFWKKGGKEMKKLMLVFAVLFLGSFVNAQQWDDFWDMSEYTRFTEKKYKIIRSTMLFDKDGDVIAVLKSKKPKAGKNKK